MMLRGRNLKNGLPEAVEVSSIELREALRSVGQHRDRHDPRRLDETPPELVADLMEAGICMAAAAAAGAAGAHRRRGQRARLAGGRRR